MRFLIILLFCLSANAQTVPKFPAAGNVTAQFTAGQHGTVDAGHRWAHWYYLSDDGFRWIATWQVLRRDKVLVTVPEVKGETAQAYMARVRALPDDSKLKRPGFVIFGGGGPKPVK